jgi:uncharacterized coiled-coil DUF342 family protein
MTQEEERKQRQIENMLRETLNRVIAERDELVSLVEKLRAEREQVFGLLGRIEKLFEEREKVLATLGRVEKLCEERGGQKDGGQ